VFRITFLFPFLFSFNAINAQEETPRLNTTGNSKKGQLFITWGYNRAYYNESDIHFKGDGYDFTLYDVAAEDIPEEFDPKVYFNPVQLTVPQFNFRVGYYFKENTALSIGWDHMKYHIIPTQLLVMDGYIDPEKYPSVYSGQYNSAYFMYEPGFMNYHHSDGFNFIRVALEQRLPFFQSRNGKHVLAMNGSVSLGAMMPWTDFTFLGVNHRNKPHFAGYGASLHAGFRYEFFKYFFVQAMAQVGWSNLPDIMLEDHLPSRAEQKITFIERSWALGGYIPVKKQKQPKAE